MLLEPEKVLVAKEEESCVFQRLAIKRTALAGLLVTDGQEEKSALHTRAAFSHTKRRPSFFALLSKKPSLAIARAALSVLAHWGLLYNNVHKVPKDS